MQENCHGALAHSTATAQRERDAGTRFTGVTDNFSGIAAREAENRPPNEDELRGVRRYRKNSGAFVGKTTMDCCRAMWHRVGGRMFVWGDVKDLLRSPKQLASMRIRGYVTKVQKATGSGNFYQGAIWQMTEQAHHLAEVAEGKWL